MENVTICATIVVASVVFGYIQRIHFGTTDYIFNDLVVEVEREDIGIRYVCGLVLRAGVIMIGSRS